MFLGRALRVALMLVAIAVTIACDSGKKAESEHVGSSENNLVLLGEDFESGSWPSRIQRSGNCAKVWAGAGNGSSFGAQLRETCSVQNSVELSTQGYTGIQVKYDYRTRNFDAGEALTLEWSKDGKAWQVVAAHSSTPSWTTATVTLPVAAEGQAKLFIRLSTNANGDSGAESADIDNFSISGTPPAGCNFAQLCTAAATSCGTITAGSCGTFSCGSCAGGEKCSNKACVTDCSAAAQCGSSLCGSVDVPGCGAINCGACGADEACVAGTCVDSCSTPAVCAAHDVEGEGTSCGTLTDGRCGEVDCGKCKSGPCEDNLCACTPKSCEDLEAQCGRPDDGCGHRLDCGMCGPATEVCSPDFACVLDTCADCGPLTSGDLSQLESYLECSTTCSYGKSALLEECLAACPVLETRWDKNRDGKVDDVDRELAVIEKNDAGAGQSICYEDGAVVPIRACRSCVALKGAAFCNAKEGADWPECDDESPCDSFDRECRYVADANRKLCAPRACASAPGGCTAFHLAEVSQDNDEVVVQVHYDYSPRPATVLDLYLTYEGDKLLLGDARALPGLTARGKQLQTRQMGSNRLRLTALGEGSSAPIATGPIVELVFVRTSGAQNALSFSASASDRMWSIAPDLGLAREQLTKDSLWGGTSDSSWARSLTVRGADPNGNRLLLHYSFDNSQKPLDVAKVESAEALCQLQVGSGNCAALLADGSAPPARVKAISRYAALQRGFVQAGEAVTGVSGKGVFLDGISDHLELPITLNQPLAANSQNFTASFWFYGEGGQGAARQVLWSHNHPLSENALFAVTLAPKANDTFDLEWMSGTLTGTATNVIKAGLPNHRWMNLAVAYDASTQKVQFYLDGSPVLVGGTAAQLAAPALQCPQFSPGFKVGEEGAGTGTKTPQLLYFASEVNGLYGLERMDTTGLAQKRLLREPDNSAMDVNYSPILDKLVFSSSKSGSYEIWVADGDGANARQVTFGFGDTARRIAARRPRWAPDASAIVFESNVYSVTEGDNQDARAYRLFYLAYDATKNEVAIPFGDGQVLTSIEYSQVVARVSAQSEARILDRYRLTTTGANASNAFWASPTELWYTANTARGDDPRVAKLVITPQHAANSSSSLTTPFTDPETDVTLLAATVDSTGADANAEPVKLLKREWVSYDAATGFGVVFSTPAAGKTRAQITFNPSAPATKCWDTNLNNICDLASEDRNADNTCTVADCLAAKVENLFLLVPAGFLPEKTATGAIADKTSPRTLSAKKDLRLTEVVTSVGNFVRLEVRSDIDIAPIPSGTTLATLDFNGTGATTGFQLQSRTVNQQLNVHHPGKAAGQQLTAFVTTGLEEVLEAAFSPNAEQLAVSAIERARPVIVTTPDLVGTVSGTKKMRKISNLPVAVEGLQWTAVERALPCNWMGAFRDPGTKAYLNAFRGGLDEVRLHSYVRSAASIKSDADRGLERLAKEQPGGPPAKSVACSVSTDCPAYQVCGAGGTCTVKSCDPADAYSCNGTGKCTLASSVQLPGGAPSDYVCAAECGGSGEVANTACFSQQCRNGPCRFCDGPTSSCVECRTTTTTDSSGVTTSSVEGCPDRNSYACSSGSCVTQCYSFANNESKYLCDPATEYCKQGRCMTFDWSWADLAPATFSGMSEMHVDGFTPTVAISQSYPVLIKAYGVEDYGHSPLMLVQGRVKDAPGFLGQWFDLGKVTVYNRTPEEAGDKPYLLSTSYPITDLRVKLIAPPIDNQNSASTGLAHLARDTAFCGSGRDCDRRPPGSLPLLGYSVGVPKYEVKFAADCRAAGVGSSACDWATLIKSRPFLIGGSHAVIVTDATVAGHGIVNRLSKHKACKYNGGSAPLDAVTFGRQFLWFGSPQLEKSNQKNTFYPSAPSSGLLDLFAAPLPNSLLLINCTFSLPDPSGDGFAGNVVGLEFSNLGVVYNTTQSGKISENANGCTVDLGGNLPQRCYEAVGDARLDFMTQDVQIFKTLELDDFTSFGYATNSP